MQLALGKRGREEVRRRVQRRKTIVGRPKRIVTIMEGGRRGSWIKRKKGGEPPSPSPEKRKSNHK